MLQATRRNVLLSTVWTAPVVTFASAAPAFAASGVPDLAFNAGTSSVVVDGDFLTVETRNAVVTVAPNALSDPAQLTLTVAFVPTAGDDELYSDLTAPPGWVHAPRSAAVRNLLVFTHGTLIAESGGSVSFGDGSWFGTDDVAQRGAFVLTFEVGTLTCTWTVLTP